MKGIIMAGGQGTRLNGLKSPRTNKHILPVYDRPMIEWPMRTLVGMGVDDIMVLLDGPGALAVMEILEDGSRFSSSFELSYKYIRQGGSPGRDIRLAERWLGGEAFVLILGDSIFTARLCLPDMPPPHIWAVPDNGFDDPSKYGQVKVIGRKVVCLVEKPKEKVYDLIQTGIWFLPGDFCETATMLAKNAGHELHIGDIVSWYARTKPMTCTILPRDSYIDAGTPEALVTASSMLRTCAVSEPVE